MASVPGEGDVVGQRDAACLEAFPRLVRVRKAEGASFVIVEQNLEFLLSVADDILAIELPRETLEAHLVV